MLGLANVVTRHMDVLNESSYFHSTNPSTVTCQLKWGGAPSCNHMFNLTWGQTCSKINGNLSFMKCMSAVTHPTKMRVPVFCFHVHQKVYWNGWQLLGECRWVMWQLVILACITRASSQSKSIPHCSIVPWPSNVNLCQLHNPSVGELAGQTVIRIQTSLI
jgi:hypothetical protein